MTRKLSWTTAIVPVLGLLAAPAVASAQEISPWSVSFDIGTQAAVDGNVHSGGAGAVLGLPTQVTAQTYDDVYGPGLYWRAGVGYRVGDRGEMRVQGNFANNAADRLQVGSVAGLALFGLFDDYQTFGMDFGYRHYLGDNRVRPFLGGGVGFVRVETVRSEFSVPAANVVLRDVDFLDSSIVPAVGMGGGVQVDLTPRFAVQVGADFRWHGDATDNDGLAGTGLEPINDETRRWSLPVTGGVTVRF